MALTVVQGELRNLGHGVISLAVGTAGWVVAVHPEITPPSDTRPQLPRWIHRIHPSWDLCNRARAGRNRFRKGALTIGKVHHFSRDKAVAAFQMHLQRGWMP